VSDETSRQVGPGPQESAERDAEPTKPDNGLRIGAPVRVSRLHTVVAVRAEAGRLYREARAREGRYPDAQTALRLANILGTLRQAIETETLAERVQALEEKNP